MTLTAGKILDLLATKHDKDVFVPECKTGKSMGADYSIMDAWVMPKSWANPFVTAYEIKVARQDFLRDEKWHKYLDYCNYFYFVCPPKLIDSSELPDGVGLLWVSVNGKKLFTKRKAARRDVVIPESVFRYILMARACIGGEQETQKDYIKNWVESKENNKKLGYFVNGKIKKVVEAVQEENRQLKTQNQDLENIKDRIIELGLDPDNKWHVYSKLNEIVNGLPIDFKYTLDRVIKSLGDIRETLDGK